MSTAHVCPNCGKPLPSDSPKGLCPACLLAAAIPGQPDVHSVATVLPEYSTTSAAPEAGTHLKYFGDYELLEEIARGGMGIVWKARQTSLRRDVALKMIRAGALAGPDEVHRFLREAEAAANLQHPNIVAIHEVGEHGGQHYFSMDYVAGRDLGTLVKDGPLSPQAAARYVKIIAEAVHFAHQHGTLHRDLKPQNVLIDAADQPRITDFGLAKFMNQDSRMTQSGAVMGTPSYMSPEQAAGRQADIGPASDVYSLGAMLYELLTGRPPFRGSTPMATLLEVLEAEPAAPRRLKADIPLDLETICLKCLEKSPSARYPTARALAEELDRFLKGEPIQARPASAIRKTVSWARRHPGTLAALAALVMVTLAFGVFYLFEENAFLRAQQADPALARIPGPRHEFVRLWEMINGYTSVASIYLFFVLQARVRRLSLKEWFDPAKRSRRVQPLGERTRAFAIGASLVLIGFPVMLLVTAIQAHVWEGESILDLSLLGIYCSIYFGVATLGIVVRDYRLVHYGIPASLESASSRQLTAEQIGPVRRAT
jgi:predicted Ser/Thr protein kinase